MTFTSAFVECMTNQGIQIDESSLPDEGSLQSGIQELQAWYGSLGDGFRQMVDGATTNYDGSQLIASTLGVGTSIQGLLSLFDAMQGWPLSTLLENAAYCLQYATEHANDDQASAGESEGSESQEGES